MTDEQRIEGLSNALTATASVAEDAHTTVLQVLAILDGTPQAACDKAALVRNALANIKSACEGAVQTYGPA